MTPSPWSRLFVAWCVTGLVGVLAAERLLDRGRLQEDRPSLP